MWLLLVTGIRRAELLGLTWDDIDFGTSAIRIGKTLQVRPGGHYSFAPLKTICSYRCIPFDQKTSEILQQYKKWWEVCTRNTIHQGLNGLLFCHPNGKPYHPDTITKWLSGALEKQRSKTITPHGLRHTYDV